MAVSAVDKTGPKWRGGIYYFDQYGGLMRVTDTGSYIPENLAFGPDERLWTLGWQRDANAVSRAATNNYAAVRRFDAAGKEDGQFLDRSLFPQGLEPGMGNLGLRIAVTHDRVGLLAWSGTMSTSNEWIELDLEGKLLSRTRIDQGPNSQLAFSDEGQLYRKVAPKAKLEVLDRQLSAWKDAGSAPGPYLWGADGNSLVFLPSWASGRAVLAWFPEPTTSSREP